MYLIQERRQHDVVRGLLVAQAAHDHGRSFLGGGEGGKGK